jgi:Schlafen, AlbA_2
MDFTALHRLLGRPPGPLTDEMIDEAVSQGVAETDDLDCKSSLPPASGLPQTDFPKDIAAMANSGGGVIAYGVTEQGKQATGRTDTGELTEGHERSLRSVPSLPSPRRSSGSVSISSARRATSVSSSSCLPAPTAST